MYLCGPVLQESCIWHVIIHAKQSYSYPREKKKKKQSLKQNETEIQANDKPFTITLFPF